MIKPLIGLFVAGATVWRWAQHHRRFDGDRQHAKAQAKKAVQTWEGEGGALPVPAPATTRRRSR